MRHKKLLIIFLVVLCIGILGFIIASNLAFSGWTDSTVKKGDELIKTSLGDEFIFQYVTRNFPDYETDVTILDKTKRLASYHIEGDFSKPEIIVRINTSDLKCYEVKDCIVFKKKGEDFKGINLLLQTSPSDLAHNNQTKDFVDVAKILVAKKEWKWIKTCGRLLMSAGDADIKKTLERYAANKFTQEELDLNKNSEVKKEDIQVFAKQVLEQK